MKSYDNFFIPVDDLEKAKEYYSKVLGLKIKFDFSDKGMIAFNIGNEEPTIILKDKNKFPNVKGTIWFVVDNVDEEYELMKSRGVDFISEPFKIGTGMAAEFKNRFGNCYGIADYT